MFCLWIFSQICSNKKAVIKKLLIDFSKFFQSTKIGPSTLFTNHNFAVIDPYNRISGLHFFSELILDCLQMNISPVPVQFTLYLLDRINLNEG